MVQMQKLFCLLFFVLLITAYMTVSAQEASDSEGDGDDSQSELTKRHARNGTKSLTCPLLMVITDSIW